jgi:hypothetical protein
MAIMKIKNENGEWVSGAPVNFLHQFKYAYVEPTSADGTTNTRLLDLSPYVQSNADFMLIMYPDFTNNRVATVYIHSDGKIRQFNGNSGYGDIGELDDAFPLNTSFDESDFAYDDETRIMRYRTSVAGRGFNTSMLIYAG